jgi:hypothetical protein
MSVGGDQETLSQLWVLYSSRRYFRQLLQLDTILIDGEPTTSGPVVGLSTSLAVTN